MVRCHSEPLATKLGKNAEKRVHATRLLGTPYFRMPRKLVFDRRGSKPLRKQLDMVRQIAPDVADNFPVSLLASDRIKAFQRLL